MPREVGCIRLGDVVTLVRGTTYKSALLGREGPVLLGLASIQRDGGFRGDSLKTYGGDSPQKLLMYPGDLYVSLKDVTQSGDLLGSVARVPRSVQLGRLTQDTVKLVPTLLDYPRDLLYWSLRAPQYRAYCRERAIGTTNLSLSRDDFLAFQLPAPAEARLELVRLLEGLEHRIDLLRQTNATLESIAQALFKSWFIDFDPVRAKAEEREPEGMDAETAALFPSEFEESELGAIPKGWGVRPFADTVETVGGGTPKTNTAAYWDGDIPWFSVVDAPAAGQVFTVATEKTITKLGVDNSSTRILPKWSTIISARGTVGKLALTGVEMAMNQSCYGLKPKVDGGETATYLATQRLVANLKRLAHGGVFDTITRDTLRSVHVCDAPSEIIKAFDTLTRPLFERILGNALQSRSLVELRDTLLPRLISGKLRIPEAQLAIEGAIA
ncbi:MAG: restriction endonuclease subunit S [Proteobacteria bacterium]|nr:restriction endonuclease subunit S [Pseudomonadota bacterium]